MANHIEIRHTEKDVETAVPTITGTLVNVVKVGGGYYWIIWHD